MKNIIVSMRVDEIIERFETRDSIDQKLIKFLFEADLSPTLISNSTLIDKKEGKYKNLEKYLNSLSPDGFILSGGNDIGDYCNRDLTELFLINYAVNNNLPLLGICRGMQMLAHWDGIKLKKVNNFIGERKTLSGKFSHSVLSYFNYALNGVSDNFNILAESDKTIMAIRHKSKKMEGWMWHPEREKNINKIDLERIKYIFS